MVHVSVRASTIRAVTSESATGTTKKEKVRTMLTLTIEDIDYDTEACKLSLKGRNIEENPHVKMGAYHRLDLEMNRSVLYFITVLYSLSFLAFDSLMMFIAKQSFSIFSGQTKPTVARLNFAMVTTLPTY